MSDTTHVSTPSEPSLDDVLAQYIAGEESGQPLDRQELLARYPQFSGDLREFFSNRDQMQRLAEPLKAPAATSGARRQLLGKIRYFGDYELLDEIAVGGMGIVYKARQVSLNRIVAVKMILKGTLAREEDVKRFRAEAEAAASLQHPGIVAIHEVGLHEGQHYFSMDFVDGHSLAELPREQPLSARQAAEYIRDAAEAVHYAHQQGTLHRDLKPSNILIDRRGRVRITDFGLAKRIEGNSDLTLTGQILGTPSYMPPEQALGKRSLIGVASDIYSLGAVLYELLTGRPPFRGESPAETLRQVESLDPISPRLLSPTIPRDLETICLKCLEKEPHKRYGTGQLVAEDLGRYLRGEPIVARPVRAWQRATKWVRRHPTAAALAVMSLVALLAVVGLLVGQGYNARLKTLNEQLAGAKTSLETRNAQLSATKEGLETSNRELGEASTKLENALEDVKAERARARRYLYTARMALVQRAEQEKKPGRVVQLLRSLIPESPAQEDLRDFEWHYLWRKYCGEQVHLAGHLTPVTALAFSSNRSWIASGSDDGILKLWDAATGIVRHTLNAHKQRITAISFAPYSSRFITASSDGTLKLWDLASLEEIRSLSIHTARLTVATIAPNGRYVACGYDDGKLFLWDEDFGKEIANHDGNGQEIRGLAFTADSASLIVATNGSLGVWKPLGKDPLEFSPATTTTTNISFSQGAGFFASGNALHGNLGLRQKNRPATSTLTTWDRRKNISVQSFDVSGTVVAVAFSPDGTSFATAIAESEDNTVRVWNAENGNELYVHHDQSAMRSLTFSADGGQIAAGTDDGAVVLWTLPGKGSRTFHEGTSTANSLSFGDQGRKLGALVGNQARIWDLVTGQEVDYSEPAKSSPFSTHSYQRLALSPANTLIAGVVPETLLDTAKPGTRPLQGWTVTKPGGGSGGPYASAFSNDGTLVAEASGSTWVAVWNTHSRDIVQSIEFDKYVASVALSPDNRLVAAGTGNGALDVWELSSGRSLLMKRIIPFGVWGLAFSPDGTLLAAATGLYGEKGGNTNAVQVWSTSNWELLYDLHGHTQCVWTVAFNPTGTRLASAASEWRPVRAAAGAPVELNSKSPYPPPAGEVKVWDLATGHEVLTIAEPRGGIMAATFSPDGKLLATAGQTGRVMLWDGSPVLLPPTYEPLVEVPSESTIAETNAEATGNGTQISGPPSLPNATRVQRNMTPPRPVNPVKTGFSQPISSAEQLSRAGRWNEATIEYSKTLKLHPEHPTAWRDRAAAYVNLRKWEEAAADYREAVRLQPTVASLRTSLANSLRNKGDLDAAAVEYTAALQMEPHSSADHYGLGLTFSAKEEFEKAIAEYSEAIELDGKYQAAWRSRAWANVKLTRRDEAIADLREALRLKSTDVWAQDTLASTLRNKGDLDAALVEYQKALQMDPKRAETHYGLGLTFAAKRSYDDAVWSYRNAIQFKPNYPEAHYSLGNALRRLDKFEEAIFAYQDSIRHKFDYAPAHNGLAWLLITCPDKRLLDPERAVDLAEKATILANQNANYWNTLGVACFRAGSYPAAIAALEKSEQIAPAGTLFGSNALFLAMSHWQNGGRQQALGWYEQAAQWIAKNEIILENNGRAPEIQAVQVEAANLLGIQAKAR